MELNVLPLREENGRVQREFIRCLALQAGYQIDWTRVKGSKILKTMILFHGEDSELKDIIKR